MTTTIVTSTMNASRTGPGGQHSNMRGWSPDEDALLLRLHEEQGPRWKHIAATLTGGVETNERTPAMVRNRYLRILKGRDRAAKGISRNKCGRCGLLKQGHVCLATTNINPSLALQQKAHAAARGEPSSAPQQQLVLAPTVISTPPLALSEVAPVGGGGLSLGGAAPLTCVDHAEAKDANGNPLSANPLFAPIVGFTMPLDSKGEGEACKDAMASLPIAASCVWSPATSPADCGAADTPEGHVNAWSLAGLLAPTPEGSATMPGAYSFPLGSKIESAA